MTLQYNNCAACGKDTIDCASHRGLSFCSKACEDRYKYKVYDIIGQQTNTHGKFDIRTIRY